MRHIDRRGLLGAAGLVAMSYAWADQVSPDVAITRVLGFDLPTRRSKVAGKNARLDVHGERSIDRMLRVETNSGVVALGNCRADERAASQLLGKRVGDFFIRDQARMIGPLGAGTMPLWDLFAKLVQRPAYELLREPQAVAAEKKRLVPVYDGSIYFADLLPQFADRPMDRFRKEIDMGLALGHRAFKVKIGRGHKWMPTEEGYQRDLDVLRAIRAHAGPDTVIGVDANNGYNLVRAKRLFSDLPGFNFAFAEELFPETIDDCLALKEHIREGGWKTLLADGETQDKLEAFKPFIAAKAIDVLQGDMNHFGFEGIMTEASWARPQGILIAPHNWGSLIGYYMQLHVGLAIDNFYRAEHDPLTADGLSADGYAIRDGLATVSDAPGFGLAVSDAALAKMKVRFDRRA